jgi:hypothetical protein
MRQNDALKLSDIIFEFVREQKDRMGWKQREFERRSGINQQTISTLFPEKSAVPEGRGRPPSAASRKRRRNADIRLRNHLDKIIEALGLSGPEALSIMLTGTLARMREKEGGLTLIEGGLAQPGLTTDDDDHKP